jgi:serine/threonine-protein kinase
VLDKAKPLGRILLDQGALAAADQELLEVMVQRHLEKHGHDAERSLAALAAPEAVRAELRRIADRDLDASLAQLPATPSAAHDSPSTTAPVAGDGARFHILRPHARGGLGEVFVARDGELNREVALKEIQARHADHPESRARFVREAEITGGLEHPGIVPVYALGQYADGRPYYAMRFIHGDSLKQAIERYHAPSRLDAERNLELRQLLSRFIAVCNAIGYAHSRGVLHRDLKPSNIMLGEFGETLVVDWGLAKSVGRGQQSGTSEGEDILLDSAGSPEGKELHLERTTDPVLAPQHSELTRIGQALGTPAYMSPEQAAGRLDQLGPTSDVYSLGATLYHLLTGQAPFARSDIGAVLKKVRQGDFAPPRQVNRQVPAALEAICLMSFDSQKR